MNWWRRTKPQIVKGWLQLGLLSAVLIFAALPEPLSAQPPDGPPLPRLHGICRLDDGPKPGWRALRASALGVTIPYPPGWSVREAERGRRVAFLDRSRTVFQARSVDPRGQSPLEWVRARPQAEKNRQCRMVEIGTRVGQQCVDPGTRTSTTFLALSNRVLVLEAAGTVPRDTLCGILMGMEDLARW